jgi:hypothetical protein
MPAMLIRGCSAVQNIKSLSPKLRIKTEFPPRKIVRLLYDGLLVSGQGDFVTPLNKIIKNQESNIKQFLNTNIEIRNHIKIRITKHKERYFDNQLLIPLDILRSSLPLRLSSVQTIRPGKLMIFCSLDKFIQLT